MKKLLLILLIAGCSKPVDKMQQLCENHLKASMNDPASYEFVSFVVIDTIYNSPLKDEVDRQLTECNNYKGSDYDTLTMINHKRDSLYKAYSTINATLHSGSIHNINYRLVARGKNSFGGVITNSYVYSLTESGEILGDPSKEK